VFHTYIWNSTEGNSSLGRKDDQTPFVVEWFVRQGIEVWSAVEGQQRFDNHVDKLLNDIRYWRASGESMKTSVRKCLWCNPFGHYAALTGSWSKTVYCCQAG